MAKSKSAIKKRKAAALAADVARELGLERPRAQQRAYGGGGYGPHGHRATKRLRTRGAREAFAIKEDC